MTLTPQKTLGAVGVGLLAAASFTALAEAGPVAADAQEFAGAREIVIKDVLGTINVEVGSVYAVTISGADEGGPLEVDIDDGVVTIDGDDDFIDRLFKDDTPWRPRWGGGSSEEMRERFEEYLEDYPTMTVTVPRDGTFRLDGGAAILSIEAGLGVVDIDGPRESYGTVGDARHVTVGIAGSGKLSFGSVGSDLDASIGGSGDLSFDAVGGNAEVRIGGSGDVEIDTIAGNLDLRIGGSGDVETGNIAGYLDAWIAGSGDISVGDVGGDTDLSINGSGDVRIDKIAAALGVSINGSGDVKIEGGRASSSKMSILGSGDIDFSGLAVNPVVRVRGSGDVKIDEYEGDVRVTGQKKGVRIGNLRFDDDD